MTCEGGGSLEIYLEPVLPKPELLIVGRSPVAAIVAQLGRLLEFKVCIADTEANKEQFPDADLIITDLDVARSHISEASFVVVATMGNGDEEGLQAVVGTTPKYLGLVASKKKVESLFEYLRGRGTTDDQLAVIRCPAGIELGGETIPEIALSVMAEITQVRRTSSASTVSLPVAETAGSLDAKDPVCGMVVSVGSAKYTSVFKDETFYFCCLRCKVTFDRSPQNYPQIL
jgi:xanthine dehydrogenase accessory factor